MDKVSLQRRVLLVSILLVLAFGGLSARIVYVQVVMHDEYALKARSERMFTETLAAKRGKIFDRHGELLVGNNFVCKVVADRNHLRNIHVCRKAVARAEGLRMGEVAARFDDDEVCARFVDIAVATLGEFIGEEAEYVRSVVDGSAGKVRAIVSRGLPFDRAEEIRAALEESGIRGFSFEDDSVRIYPNPGRLAQVIGFMNAEHVGSGIEAALDEQLAGTPGFRRMERTRRSSELLSEHAEEVAPRDGADVVLTIDMELQCIVERCLEDAVALHSPEKIMAVFMDPMTGEVLAMASRPHFDQSDREGVHKIHPVADRYEPGSTFKIVAIAAAVEEGLVNRNTQFFCHNGLYNEPPVRLSDSGRGHAYLEVEGIMKKSSNIGTYLIAKQLGAARLHEYITDFGFGKKTGIALTGEARGQVADPSSRWWSKTSLSRVAIGYEVDVTALQMANALSAIANGGNLMKPQIVRSVTSAEGERLYSFNPRKVRRVVSESTADEVRRMLLSVVGEDGTGKRGAVEGFAVAGKTATAWKPKADRSKGYYVKRRVVSFMGFLPAENPRLAGIVVVDDPALRGEPLYGGTVAAPVFSAIATEAMRCMGVKPTVVPRRAARALPRTVAVDAERF